MACTKSGYLVLVQAICYLSYQGRRENVANAAFHNGRVQLQQSFKVFEIRLTWEGWRLPFLKVGENKPQVLPHGIAGDTDLLGKRLRLCRLLDTLSRAILLPAMIEAADAILLHPTDG